MIYAANEIIIFNLKYAHIIHTYRSRSCMIPLSGARSLRTTTNKPCFYFIQMMHVRDRRDFFVNTQVFGSGVMLIYFRKTTKKN